MGEVSLVTRLITAGTLFVLGAVAMSLATIDLACGGSSSKCSGVDASLAACNAIADDIHQKGGGPGSCVDASPTLAADCNALLLCEQCSSGQ